MHEIDYRIVTNLFYTVNSAQSCLEFKNSSSAKMKTRKGKQIFKIEEHYAVHVVIFYTSTFSNIFFKVKSEKSVRIRTKFTVKSFLKHKNNRR